MMEQYIARINRVLDHIDAHIAEPLRLEDLAAVAHFSPYHFHRLFRGLTGETLSRYVQRVRVEKAASRLMINPAQPITEVALDCGFSGSSAFARAFKAHFGVAASDWRATDYDETAFGREKSKMREALRKARKVFEGGFGYSGGELLTWRTTMEAKLQSQVEVKDRPATAVAYVRHVGPYKGDGALFERLFTDLFSWAGPRGLFIPGQSEVLAVYHDDPNVTEEEKLRLSICLSVPPETPVEAPMGKMELVGGTYAVAHYELSGPADYEQAWMQVYGEWLPQSGYQPADGLPFESYLNNPREHPEGKHIVDICVPVKPL